MLSPVNRSDPNGEKKVNCDKLQNHELQICLVNLIIRPWGMLLERQQEAVSAKI